MLVPTAGSNTEKGNDMNDVTKLNETIRYTVTNRRYIDGEYVDSKRTATVTHTVKNYRDMWTREVIELGYQVTIFDHLDGGTSYVTMSDADFTQYWVSQAI